MPRTFARILVGLVIFIGAAAIAFVITPRLASDSLRLEAEKRLTVVMGSPVSIGHARLTFGFGFRLEGTDVSVWNEPGREPGLAVERLRASIRPSSLLMGKVQFAQIVLEGARLRIEHDGDGNWSPLLPAMKDRRRKEANAAAKRHSHELLSPLITLENVARAVLEKRRIADSLEVRNSTIVFVDARAESPLAPPLLLALESVHGELRRSRLTGAGRVKLQGRLIDAQRTQGALELDGSRSRKGEIRVALAMTDLDATALAPYVRRIHPTARIEASVSGAVVFETARPGDATLEVDLVGHGVRSLEPSSNSTGLSVKRIAATGKLQISPQQVRLVGGRIRGGEFDFEADATLARPLRVDSFAQIDLAFREVEVAEVRHIIGWLPEVEREEAEGIVGVVEQGRLHTLRAGGSATLSAWQAFLAGRTRTPPAEFVIDATLSDTVIRVGDDDRLEDISGRLWWSGNRTEVINGRGTLNGSPLPVLDVAVEGVTNFLAGDPARRQLDSGGVPLRGLQPLWQWFQRDRDEDDPKTHIAVGLVIDRLHHPLFLWPIENLSAALWDTEQGLHIVTDAGTWAGVPISGDADWNFEPEERVRAELTATAPEEGAAIRSESDAWTEGDIVLGIRHGGAWGQQHASSRFSARGGVFQFDEVQLPLNPQGDVDASIELDVGLPDRVPFQLSFDMEGGSVEALAEQLGQPPEIGTGTVDIAGSFDGALRPGVPFLDGLSGLMEVVGVDGTVRKSLPAFVAVALASQAFNPFLRRDEVRYERCETTLQFEDGRMSTTGFSLDGPDMRVFATGELDLLRAPHIVDAQVALFLFRQIDMILEKIPIVNYLLLGTNDNLVGAHFRLSGPWEDPKATAVPFRALATGPASIIEQGPTSIVLQTVPLFMMKGIEAIETMLGLGKSKQQGVQQAPPAAKPNES